MPEREPEIDVDYTRAAPRPYTWDEAALEARAQIAWHQRRIKILEGCIKTFKDLKKSGMEFPQ